MTTKLQNESAIKTAEHQMEHALFMRSVLLAESFSEKYLLGKEIEKYCEKNNISKTAHGFLCALQSMGYFIANTSKGKLKRRGTR